MIGRNIWLTGFLFLFIVSFAIYGNIKETERKRELVKRYIVADLKNSGGYKTFFGLAESWHRCIGIKEQAGSEFEYEVCNFKQDGVEERWSVEYRTQIGGALAVYRYSDAYTSRVFECVSEKEVLKCRVVK